MPDYNLKYLIKCFRRDKAKFQKNTDNKDIIPEKLHSHCPIPFICKCGTNHIKRFQTIDINGGAFCKPCAKKNNTKKGHITRKNKIPEDVQKKIHEERIRKDNEEKKLRKERDHLIKGKQQILNSKSDDEYFIHPEIKTHRANKKGEVYNISTGKLVKGSKRPLGYIRDKFNNKPYERHRFVFECLYDIIIGDRYQIDHIDAKPSNNNYSNLQMLTHKEHGSKTSIDNPNKGNISKNTSSKVVIRIKINDDNTEGEIIKYESLTEAKKENKIDISSITKSINTNKPFRGYLYKFKEETNTDIEGEIWKDMPIPSNKKILKLQISNKGRLIIKNKKKEYISIGRPDSEGYYLTDYGRMHTLVAKAFIGEPPEGMTSVNHIDKNRGNNSIENLEWSNPQLQVEHAHNISVEIYDLKTYEIIKQFESFTKCAEKYDIPSSTISHIVNLSKSKKNNIHYKITNTNYSVRKQGLSLEDKKLRELKILEYQLEIYFRANNKRKEEYKELPTHIYKSSNKFVLDIDFMNIKKRIYNTSIEKLIEERNNIIKELRKWFEEKLKLIEPVNEIIHN